VGSVVNARGLDHNEIALLLALGGFLQATDDSLCHLKQTGLFGGVTVDLTRNASVLSVSFTPLPICAYLVAHVRACEQTDVRFGGVLPISRLKVVEGFPVQDDIVTLLAGIIKNILAIRTSGAGGGVRDEEA
jgi:hypothetical protein